MGGGVSEIKLAHVVGRHHVYVDVGHLVTGDDHSDALATKGCLLGLTNPLGHRHEMRHRVPR